MDKAKISRRAFAGLALAACTGLVTPMVKAPRGRRVDALLARMSVADKIAQLNIPVCLPQELLGDSTDPTGTREHREAYVRGETVVGRRRTGSHWARAADSSAWSTSPSPAPSRSPIH